MKTAVVIGGTRGIGTRVVKNLFKNFECQNEIRLLKLQTVLVQLSQLNSILGRKF